MPIQKTSAQLAAKPGKRGPAAASVAAAPGAGVPEGGSIEDLREAAQRCRACPLWKKGTQTVFGEGSVTASVVFVGEQPGHEEDLAGRPFVGPAGRILDEALVEAGIDRADAYITNAVKHFKWEPRGKRRLHQRPNASEIAACKPWLAAELRALRPKVLVCLGATAAQSLIGRDFKVTRHRGEWIESNLAPRVIATVHPSAILRVPDDEARREAMKHFTNDLRKVARAISADSR